MPVIIEELTTTVQVQDEVRIRKLVRDEVKNVLASKERKTAARGMDRVDAADPAAAGGPKVTGG